jgi:ATP-dependent Lon protease
MQNALPVESSVRARKRCSTIAETIAPHVLKNWDAYVPQGHAPPKPSPGVVAILIDIFGHDLKIFDPLSLRRYEKNIKIMALEKANKDAPVVIPTIDDVVEGDIDFNQGTTNTHSEDDVKAIVEQAAAHFKKIREAKEIEEAGEVEDPSLLYYNFMTRKDFNESLQGEGDDSQNKKRYMQRLVALATKKLAKKANTDALEKLELLAREMPNFSEVIDDIKSQVGARIVLEMPIKLQPILLLGSPGIGKTRFIKRVAQCIGLDSHLLNLGGTADGLKLKGVSRGWGSARPGDLASKLCDGETFNPIFMLDEIDKTGRGDRTDALHDIPGLLLSYLEKETSNKIEDEYIAKPMDLSMVNWVFTANSVATLPDHFLSRVDVYNIPDFNKEQFKEVVKKIIDEVKYEEYKGRVLIADNEAIEALCTYDNAREVKREVSKALARAIAAGSIQLTAEYIKCKPVEKVNTLGFF